MEYLTDGTEMTLPISRVAELTGISAANLRFYEREGVLQPPRRNWAKQRVYGEKELSAVFGLLCMRKAGFTLPEIREFFELAQQGDRTLPQRLNMLEAQGARILRQIQELQECMDYTRRKMAYMQQEYEARQKGEHLPPGELRQLLDDFVHQREQHDEL